MPHVAATRAGAGLHRVRRAALGRTAGRVRPPRTRTSTRPRSSPTARRRTSAPTWKRRSCRSSRNASGSASKSSSSAPLEQSRAGNPGRFAVLNGPGGRVSRDGSAIPPRPPQPARAAEDFVIREHPYGGEVESPVQRPHRQPRAVGAEQLLQAFELALVVTQDDAGRMVASTCSRRRRLRSTVSGGAMETALGIRRVDREPRESTEPLPPLIGREPQRLTRGGVLTQTARDLQMVSSLLPRRTTSRSDASCSSTRRLSDGRRSRSEDRPLAPRLPAPASSVRTGRIVTRVRGSPDRCESRSNARSDTSRRPTIRSERGRPSRTRIRR